MPTDTPLKSRIQDDMKAAMRAKEKARLSTIRMLLAAVKQREIDEQITLNNEQILTVLEKMIKQRRDSIKQYEQADRPELADIEKTEIVVLQDYMPEQMSLDEITSIIAKVVADTGANGPRDIGKVMGAIKPLVQGKADMGTISQQIKATLASL